jgi:hypothetical protein
MRRLVVAILCNFAFHAAVSAHVVDEYMEAAQIAVASDGVRVELRFTPGVDVADRVLALIDLDRNGEISQAEGEGYVQRVLQDVALSLDSRQMPLTLIGLEFPAIERIKGGTGTIRIDLKTAAPLSAPGLHQLSFRNDHLPDIAQYGANVLVPETTTIQIGAQRRDEFQHVLQTEFRILPSATPWGSWRIITPLSGLGVIVLALGWWGLHRFFR